MSDVWHVPSDDDPTVIVEIHPVSITPGSDELRAAEKEVHAAYVALRVALERLHHVLYPPGTMQGEEGRP